MDAKLLCDRCRKRKAPLPGCGRCQERRDRGRLRAERQEKACKAPVPERETEAHFAALIERARLRLPIIPARGQP